MIDAPSSATRIVRFGPFELDLRSGELRRNGSRVSLQDQPLQILSVLLERPGELVAREELRQRLWPADTFVDFEHGLNAAVKRLRDALGDSADTPRFVETVPRRGYRFVAPVETAAALAPSARRALARRRGWAAVAMAAAFVAVTLAIVPHGWRATSRAGAAPAPVRFTIDVEQSGVTSGGLLGGVAGAEGGLVAFCPDGSCIAYRGAQQGIGRLYLHSMDRLTSTPLIGTEGGYGPFFSPDGRWLGFFADGHLKKISLATSAVDVLCEAPDPRGGAWAADGSIFFAPRRASPIWRVSADGGPPEMVSHLDERSHEMSHRWPLVLPGQRVLVYQSMDTSERSRIVSQSLATAERRTLVERGEGPRLAPSGHLLFSIEDSLWAVPFDAETVRVEGAPVEVVKKPFGGRAVAAGRFDVSVGGALVHTAHPAASNSVLCRVERSGRASPLSDLRRGFKWPRFSPDGQRLAVTIADGTGASIWVYDVPRRSLTRVTVDGGQNEGAIWAPDGRRLLYRSNRTGPFNLFLQRADGSGEAEQLVMSERHLFPGSWSPDSRALIFEEESYAHGPDIWVQSLTGRQTRRPIATSAFGEWDGVISPDGRLVAFASMESGRLEVYVQSYPGPGGKKQVSNEGGNSPVWSRSGRELFYLNGDKMMVVSIGSRGGIPVGRPELLFEGEYAFAGHVANYDVTPDGRAFVMIRGEGKKPWMQLDVVLNWSEELKRRVPRNPDAVGIVND